MKRKIIILFLLGSGLPPMAWFALLFLSGIVPSMSHITEILFRPFIHVYIFTYMVFGSVFLARVVNRIYSDSESLDAKQAGLRLLARMYLSGMFIYGVTGAVIATYGLPFLDSAKFILSLGLAAVTILLFSVPPFLMFIQILEKGTAHLPLPEQKNLKFLSFGSRTHAAVLTTVIGGNLVILISMLAMVMNHFSAGFQDLLIRGILFTSIVCIIGIINTFILVRQVKSAYFQVNQATRAIEEGDLSKPIELLSRDETGLILSELQNMQSSLAGMVQTIRQKSEKTAQTSEPLQQLALSVADSAREQASASEETSSVADELATVMNRVRNRMQEQSRLVREGKESLQFTGKESELLSKRALAVRDAARNSHGRANAAMDLSKEARTEMDGIKHAVENIQSFLKVISGISEQTNLLSLNASIEAARAGDEGRGFAVVAQEVSRLADKAGKATHEIHGLVEDAGQAVIRGYDKVEKLIELMAEIKSAASETEIYGEGMASGLLQAKESLQEQSNRAADSDAVATEVERLVREQSDGLNSVVQAMKMNSSMAEKTVDSMDRLSEEANGIYDTSIELQQLVERFKTH